MLLKSGHTWIIAINRIVKFIRYNCIHCRKRDKQLCLQVMSPCPVERLKPAPAWSTIGIDLFGPFHIKCEVNKRSTGKCYAVIFTCLLVRAVHLETAPDYSTEGFLFTFRRFTAIRVFPNKVYFDGGSQLVGAANELKTVFGHLDWDQIKASGTNKNLEWVFSPGEDPMVQWLLRRSNQIHKSLFTMQLESKTLHIENCLLFCM